MILAKLATTLIQIKQVGSDFPECLTAKGL